MKKQYRYPGAQPFKMDDHRLFFGRERDTEEFARFIRQKNISVLCGKSGLGKSSLINAGVIPHLQKETLLRTYTFRFGHQSDHHSLNPDLLIEQKIAQGEKKYDNLLAKIQPEADSLWYHFKSLQLKEIQEQLTLIQEKTPYLSDHSEDVLDIQEFEDPTYILFFDQFEELFSYSTEDVQAFAQLMYNLLNTEIPLAFRRKLRAQLKENEKLLNHLEQALLFRRVKIHIVLIIRSDKLVLLNRLKSFFPKLLQRCYELHPLTKEDAQNALEKPAQLVDPSFFSPPFEYAKETLHSLMSYMSNDAGEVESFQLQILCQYIELDILPQLPSHSRMVESRHIGAIDLIFKNFYDEQIKKLGKKSERLLARRLIEDELIIGEETQRTFRSVSEITQRYKINQDLLRKIEGTRLIRAEINPEGVTFYELSHDALITPILASRNQRNRRKLFQRYLLMACLVIGIMSALIWTIFYVQSQRNRAWANLLIVHANELADYTGNDMKAWKERRKQGLRILQEAYTLLGTDSPELRKVLGKLSPEFKIIQEKAALWGAVLDSDNQHIFMATAMNAIHQRDLAGKLIQSYRGGHQKNFLDEEGIKTLALSSDDQILLSGGIDGRVIKWDVETGNIQKVMEHSLESEIAKVAFSSQEDMIMVGSQDLQAKSWSLQGNSLHSYEGQYIALSHDQKTVLTGSWDRILRIYNLNGELQDSLAFHERGITDVAFSLDDAYLLSANSSGKVILYHPERQDTLIFEGHKAAVSSLAFSPNGNYILSAGADKKALLWNKEGRIIQTLMGHEEDINSATFSKDGQFIVTASQDGSARIWLSLDALIDWLKEQPLPRLNPEEKRSLGIN